MELTERLSLLLRPAGIDLLGTAPASDWDANAPAQLRSSELLPGAQSVIVAASSGRGLWEAFRAAGTHEGEHPLDMFVSRALQAAESVFAEDGVAARRFEAAFTFEPRVDFRTLGRLAGLGELGPFGLLIHPTHGPWFGLRGAWLIDRALPASVPARSPCVTCEKPCVGDAGATTLDRSTAAMRLRCPIGVASRYSGEQIRYHHEGARPHWLRHRTSDERSHERR